MICTAHVRGGRAFTLVEALAVVAIVGLILPVAMYGISLATGAASLVKQRTAAVEIANNKLAEYLLYRQWQNGDTTGEDSAGSPVYHWTAHTEDWTPPTTTTSSATLHQITVEVTWLYRHQTRSVTLSTLVYEGEGATP